MLKRLSILSILMALSFALLAQEQKTEHLKFLDIPITGNYQTMIQKLKGKGFKWDKTGARGFQMHGRSQVEQQYCKYSLHPKQR